jgi:hypothetical protein
MNWEDFKKHPSVVATSKRFDEPEGQLLFGALLHGTIAPLNGYKEWIKLLDSFAIGKPLMSIEGPIPDVPNDIQFWYSKWNSVVENWLSELFELQKQFIVQKPQEEINWYALILKLPTIPTQISLQYAEAQQLTIPTEELSRDFIEGAIGCIEIVDKTCRRIENEEFLTLWNIAIEGKED